MATKGNTTLYKGIPEIKDAFVVIVKTEWNEAVVNKLESGAKKILKQHQVKYATIVVPGAVEIPFAVKQHFAFSAKMPDAYITLGAVVQGDTPHFDYVCKLVTDGVLQLNLSLDVPVIFGVLTTENIEQAVERAGTKSGNKGWESALTAIEMMDLLGRIE